MFNFKSILLGSALAVSTLLGGSAQAATHLACGTNSFTVGNQHNTDYVMFHNGGNLTVHVDGDKEFGSWYWSGSDAVSVLFGKSTRWNGIRHDSCDFTY